MGTTGCDELDDGERTAAHDLMKMAMLYIMTNFAEHITIESLARRFRKSTFTMGNIHHLLVNMVEGFVETMGIKGA